ncbi:monosaccharide ABC transporter substrate-binding protein, CUT2 family [Marinobacter persicus]|uniref:Monosaccharide ABC transporter substrate-binding protein, CUT2 family n=2 Tax=Marinobacter persicus TaxID=930118 RepID=A0A1I3P2G8_9GAMM|nr:LacI family transcriptional regulator [Marinobacter persicus]SFJ15530.1 monosaccharide ABC transporter substrate-binding protein, CUT2 family [Marinobacter persicus]
MLEARETTCTGYSIMKTGKSAYQAAVVFVLFVASLFIGQAHAESRQLAYLVSDKRIPFWDIMARGIQAQAGELGYSVKVFSADNRAKTELQNTATVLKQEVDGIILSPTNSSAAVTILKLAGQAEVPVVVADIGADTDNYLSYIQSDNYQGAFDLGRILAKRLKNKGWQQGRVGIVAIPQSRDNGKARTRGFLDALAEHRIKVADIHQQSDFSYRETYDYTSGLIARHPDLRAVWLQGSNRYQAALDAINDAGKSDEILLICFDAEPEFIEMIETGALVGAGMQQPFLMGRLAVRSLDRHFQGETVDPQQQVGVLAVSNRNLNTLLPIIQRNVLGQEAAE